MPYRYKHLIIITLLLSLLTACLPALQPPTATPEPVTPTPLPEPTATPEPEGSVLRLIYWQAPTIINAHLSGASKDWEASRITYEPLATFDSEGNLIPFLAAEIPTLENGGLSEDGLSVTWKLKEGVLWSDGEPFSAEDVKFTYEFIANPDVKASSAGIYSGIESVEVLDDTTVRINFKQVTPNWAQPFVGTRGIILPQHIFAGYNNANAQNAPANLQPVGTGPYRVVEYSTEEVVFVAGEAVEVVKIIYEANPFFREAGKPYFDRVELSGGGAADSAAIAVMQDGSVDYAWNVQVDAETLKTLEALGKGSVIGNPGPFVERLFLNHSDPNYPTEAGEFSNIAYPHPFLTDLRVRQAIAYAINRPAIAELFGVSGELSNNIMVARPPYQDPALKIPDSYDLDKANALLDEAGWIDSDGDGIRDKDGVEMKVLFQTTVNPLREEVQDVIKDSLEQIGIDVEKKITEVSVMVRADPTNASSIWHFYADMQLLFLGDPNPDPSTYLSYFTCAQIPQMENNWSGLNLERWCNEDFDALYQASTTEIDPEKRRELILQMNRMISEQIVTIPLIQRSIASAISANLDGVALTPWDSDVWNIKDWRPKNQ